MEAGGVVPATAKAFLDKLYNGQIRALGETFQDCPEDAWAKVQ